MKVSDHQPADVRKTVIIGPLPPPLGGISVYLYRFKKKHPETVVIDERQLPWYRLLSLIATCKTHYIYHSNGLLRRLFFRLLSLVTDNTYSLVIHNQFVEHRLSKPRSLCAILLRGILSGAESVQVVNQQSKQLIEQRIPSLRGRVKVQHAFLPPPLDEEAYIWESYSGRTTRFISAHSPLILANAYKLEFDHGTDLYGLDMCVELVSELKQWFPEIGLLFALADVGDIAYFERTQAVIERRGLSDNFHFMTGQKELWPIFRHADAFVRPTSQDGYGVSVAEAIYFGVPAIASDVCPRAEGTILFRSRDQSDFQNKVLLSLAGSDHR